MNQKHLCGDGIKALAKFHRLTGNHFIQGRGINDLIFCQRSANIKLSQDHLMLYECEETSKPFEVYQRFLLGGACLISLFTWQTYRRVVWYMEHSFDLLNPDIEYLIYRY